MTAERNDLDYLLAGYALGDLSSEELASLQHILQTSPELHQELERFQETLALLPLALEEQSPASGMRERLLSRSGDHGEATAPSHGTLKRPTPWLALLSLALGTAIALLGVDGIVLRRQMAETQAELQHHRETVAMLSQPKSRIVALQAWERFPLPPVA
ncbi:MAG: hypothetical protein HC919_10620 [Oscillatoriales cyanobacterium SM2_2_1]|nr:hypothetical protein [Oscillatoriales cyanobacterium SM2_2_1]